MHFGQKRIRLRVIFILNFLFELLIEGKNLQVAKASTESDTQFVDYVLSVILSQMNSLIFQHHVEGTDRSS